MTLQRKQFRWHDMSLSVLALTQLKAANIILYGNSNIKCKLIQISVVQAIDRAIRQMRNFTKFLRPISNLERKRFVKVFTWFIRAGLIE